MCLVLFVGSFFFLQYLRQETCLLSSPPLLCSHTVDHSQGTDWLLLWKCSQDYGITPEYICKRNEDVKRAQEEYDNYIQENLKKAAMKRLSDEEREAVLQVSLWASGLSNTPSPTSPAAEARASSLKAVALGSSKSAE